MSRGLQVGLLLLALSASMSATTSTFDVVLALQIHFHAGCVFLLQSSNVTDVENRRTLMRQMSAQDRQVAAPDFRLKPQPCQHNKPLLVLLSSDEDTKSALIQISSERGNMAAAVWLLFIENSVEQFFEDIFVPIDCEFLVAQHGDKDSLLLIEVYRMERGLPVHQHRFGTWDPAGLHVSQYTLLQRRRDFHGTTINATSMNLPPLIEMDEKTLKMQGGMFGTAWHILEQRLNFTTRYDLPSERTWGKVHSNNKTTGIIAMIAEGPSEVAVFNMFITARRLDVMDFTIPLLTPTPIHYYMDMSRSYHIFIRQPNEMNLEWDTYLAPFSRKLWLAVILLILLIALCLPALYHLGRRHGINEASAKRSFWFQDSLFIVFGAFCQQGLESGCPQMNSCRVVYMTTYITAVTLLASYSATLVSFLTVRTTKLPFIDLEELLNVRTHKLGALEYSTVLSYFKAEHKGLYHEVYKHFLDPSHKTLVQTTINGLNRVCNSNYAFLSMHQEVLNHLKNMKCKIISLPKHYFKSSLSLGLAKNSPFKIFINYQLLTMFDDGILHKLRSEMYAPFYLQEADRLASTKNVWESMHMKHLLPILIALTVGIVLGAFCLLAERILRRLSGLKETRQHRRVTKYRLKTVNGYAIHDKTVHLRERTTIQQV